MKIAPLGLLFIPIFIFGWIGVTGLISFIGGWSRLARKFSLSEETGTVLSSFRWTSLNFNYLVAYRSCVNITITDSGVILKTAFLFSAFHKPIYFLWNDISNIEYIKGIFGSKRLVFYLDRTRVAIGARPAEVIRSKLSNDSLNLTG